MNHKSLDSTIEDSFGNLNIDCFIPYEIGLSQSLFERYSLFSSEFRNFSKMANKLLSV